MKPSIPTILMETFFTVSRYLSSILADASDEDAENLYKFGEQIGLAFQLQDDYLDVYGDIYRKNRVETKLTRL